MRCRPLITMLIYVLYFATAMGWAQDRITEEDVVSTMNGKPHAAAPGQPLGIALHVTFSPQIVTLLKAKSRLERVSSTNG